MLTTRRLQVLLASVVLLLGALATVSPVNASSVNGNIVPVNLSLAVPESITVSTSASSLAFANDGSGNGVTPSLTVSTSWTLAANRVLQVYGYYAGGVSDALTGPAPMNCTTQILSTIDGGTAGACSTLAGQAAAFLVKQLTVATAGGGTTSDTVVLTAPSVYTVGWQPGTYTGVLDFTAVAN